MTVWAAFFSFKTQAADPQVAIQLLGPEQGLPERVVRCVAQDSLGFLWVGTGAALWRYDGYSFHNYTSFLSSNSGTVTAIHDIKLGPDKRIWIAHNNGITVVNPLLLQSESVDVSRFFPKMFTSRQAVRINFDNDGTAWISMPGRSLIKLDRQLKPIRLYGGQQAKNDGSLPNGFIFKVFEDNAGQLYLFSLNNYIDVIDKAGNYLRKIELLDEALPKGYLAAYVDPVNSQYFRVYYRTDNHDKSLVRDYSFGKAAFISAPKNPRDIYPGDPYPDHRGFVWYKSENEVGFLNNNKKFTSLTQKIQDKVGAEIYLMAACVSSDNTFWLCSASGLFKINIAEPLFQTYLTIPLQKPTDIGTSMRGITEDSSGALWICSYGFKKNGNTYLLHKLDAQSGTIQHRQIRILKDTAHTSYNSAYILYKTVFAKDGMYAITDGISLLKLKPDTSGLSGTVYNVSANELTAIYAANDSMLWLGSISGMITMNTKRAKPVLLNNKPGAFIKNIRVNYFMPWRSGYMLASTSNGIYVLDSNAAIVEHYGTNKEDKIYLPVQTVYHTTWYQHILWAATANGLLRIDTTLKTTQLFTTKNGLPDNNVYACLPDDEGNLWLSTNNGLCRFNIQTKKTRSYGLADGLPQMEFNTASFLKAHTGKLYFGGLNGIISFDPTVLNRAKEEETSLQLISYSNYKATTNRVETIMGTQMQGRVDFSSGDRLFTFTFMAPDYRHTEQNRFRYKLEGWADNEWHFFETGNRLSFNSLPPGKYFLQVQVSVGGADWNPQLWSAVINVQAPWYKTAWFYGLSLLAVGLSFYALYRYRLAQIIRIQQIRNRISADMHDEIGSTLSSITFYSQALLMQPQEEKQKEVLQKIKENAQQVQEGLSDIIWSVKAGMDQIENVFSRMFSFGSELLESKNIQFHFEAAEHLNHGRLDMTGRKNFYLIFKEAINNAVKYGDCKNVWVRIREEGRHIQMVIQDDGKGFDPQHAKSGNGLTNMQQRAVQMRGTLIVRSAESYGTTITLTF